MPYVASSCDCADTSLMQKPVQCKACEGTNSNFTSFADITQKRMWKQVRAPSSLYTMNLGALNVTGGANSYRVGWNQSSDSIDESIQTAYVPTRGSSTLRTITSHKPGGSGPAGRGVDIKHNSYARYLARKKGINLKTGGTTQTAVKGNKTKTFGMITGCVCTTQS